MAHILLCFKESQISQIFFEYIGHAKKILCKQPFTILYMIQGVSLTYLSGLHGSYVGMAFFSKETKLLSYENKALNNS